MKIAFWGDKQKLRNARLKVRNGILKPSPSSRNVT